MNDALGESTAPATRLIALGNAALMTGFGLIGVETFPDATPETLETVLADLVRSDARAVVFIEQHLAGGSGPWLDHVRNESPRIVVTTIPGLATPEAYAPAVDDLVRSVLGPHALGERDGP